MKRILLLLSLVLVLVANSQNYQYLGDYTSNGTPLYLENPGDVVTGETLQLIDNSLPESYPVPDYNPHYISSGYDTDVILNDVADVFVTFVSEGAGYRNVLGFYTYDINNPSVTAPQPEDITIIFPNASALYSGGGLQAGDKVKLGTFPAGTGIGWVLLANAWNSSSSSVGYGQWQLFSNPDYNPEADPNLRYHNVLLNDPDNERVILGFEDIRRDYGSCDNDFNDAIFYITANPYDAITTVNYADVSSATDVTSANNGGLESNGSLAGLIAKRNFKRGRTGDVHNTQNLQEIYEINDETFNRASSTTSLENYLPDTGMFGTETAYVSSPQDLIGITNASEVFSLDMYSNDIRVSAVLATATDGSVYDHTKVICDRLNSSSLEDVRTVMVRGHQIICSRILRASGEIENSLSFSIKQGDLENELFSFWNISQYPQGDYYNFQIWGSSYGQVFTIANHIIDTLSAEKPLISTVVEDIVPQVFVKSGYYSNGEIHLDLVNKVGASALNFEASIAPSETAARYDMQQNVSLSGSWYDTVYVATGTLFDAGLSISVDGYAQQDALYLADGPWGLDYLEDFAEIDSFEVSNEPVDYDDEYYEIERQPTVSGVVKGNVNLFRHILPGDQTLDVTNFEAIQFEMYTDKTVEVVLIPENLNDWTNRLRYVIAPNNEDTLYNIAFEQFTDANGQSGALSNIKTVVFSVMGDYTSFQPFSLSLSELAFGDYQRLSVNDYTINTTGLKAQPNPMSQMSTISFNLPYEENVRLQIYDQLGKLVLNRAMSAKAGQNSLNINRNGLRPGLYICRLISRNHDIKPIKLMVK